VRGESGFDNPNNLIHNCVKIMPYIIISESNNLIAKFFQDFRSCPIVFFVSRFEMRTSVNFDTSLCQSTIEVNDKAIDWMLPAKFI